MFTDYRVEHTGFEHVFAAFLLRISTGARDFESPNHSSRQMSWVRQLDCAVLGLNLRILKHVRCTLQESNVTCLLYEAFGAPLSLCGAQRFKLHNAIRTAGFICPRDQVRITVSSNTDGGIRKTLDFWPTALLKRETTEKISLPYGIRITLRCWCVDSKETDTEEREREKQESEQSQHETPLLEHGKLFSKRFANLISSMTRAYILM